MYPCSREPSKKEPLGFPSEQYRCQESPVCTRPSRWPTWGAILCIHVISACEWQALWQSVEQRHSPRPRGGKVAQTCCAPPLGCLSPPLQDASASLQHRPRGALPQPHPGKQTPQAEGSTRYQECTGPQDRCSPGGAGILPHLPAAGLWTMIPPSVWVIRNQ